MLLIQNRLIWRSPPGAVTGNAASAMRFFAPPHIAGQLATAADTMGGVGVGVVSVETLLHRLRRQSQCLPSHGRLQRLQIQIGKALTAE
jgi:hypothetical protein